MSFPFAWMNGEIIPWDDAKIHVATNAITRGSSVFEGIRAYWNESEEQLNLFRNAEHLRRLYQSSKIMRMSPEYGQDDIESAYVELLRRNETREDVALRPVIYFGIGDGLFSYKPDAIDTGMWVVASSSPSKLDQDLGLHVSVSSWTKLSDNTMPPRIKIHANYQNSRLAHVQARVDGYDSTILLNERATVAEGPGACVFIFRDGVASTTPVTSGILESITRVTLIQLLEERLSTKVVEREIDRTELYIADEVFFCGTAYEITPIHSVDRYPVGEGETGPLTQSLRELFRKVVLGDEPDYKNWLLPVYA